MRQLMRDRRIIYLMTYFTIAVIACMMAAVCISVRASEHAIHESELRQCSAIQSDVDAFQAEPPVTRSGKQQLASKLDLLRRFHCPPEK